jgi:hypothetical protein
MNRKIYFFYLELVKGHAPTMARTVVQEFAVFGQKSGARFSELFTSSYSPPTLSQSMNAVVVKGHWRDNFLAIYRTHLFLFSSHSLRLRMLSSSIDSSVTHFSNIRTHLFLFSSHSRRSRRRRILSSSYFRRFLWPSSSSEPLPSSSPSSSSLLSSLKIDQLRKVKQLFYSIVVCYIFFWRACHSCA